MKDGRMDLSYQDLYCQFDVDIQPLLSSLHSMILSGFNGYDLTKSGTLYIHAKNSRVLIAAIDGSKKLQNKLQNTNQAFNIALQYEEIFDIIRPQLNQTNGSTIFIDKSHSDFVRYIKLPIFSKSDYIELSHDTNEIQSAKLIKIGHGSYADVFKYYDAYYDKYFALKKLKRRNDNKDYKRFEKEFNTLKELNSPYILEVFKFDKKKCEFTMELMDGTIEQLCQTNMPIEKRKNITNQIIHAVSYLHQKELSHRDICPQNLLYKQYDDCCVVKISDFGLVKNNNSNLTSDGSNVKGRFIDPDVELNGFNNYEPIHDLYPLAKLVAFVLTGKYSGYNSSMKTLLTKSFNHEFKNIKEFDRYIKQTVYHSI